MKRVLILLLFFSANLNATNGYFSHGIGTKSKSMAGAGVSLGEDAASGALNPANLVLVGGRLELGGSLFLPDRGFRANNDATGPVQIAPMTYDSENSLFLIPQFAYSRQLDEDRAIGVALVMNGLNTEYDDEIFRYFQRPGWEATSPTGVDLYQMVLHLPYSHRVSDRLALGIAPILALQAFRAKGLNPFGAVSLYPDDVTNNGFDYSRGLGLSLGVNFRPVDRIALGLSVQSRLRMSEFDDYRGLFAEHGDFDIPATFQVGASFRLSDGLELALDYQRIYYSNIASVGNPNDIPLMTPILGADDGIGGGWRDARVFKAGIRWQYDPQTVLRAGYSHGNQIIPPNQALLNILAPAVGRDHYTVGFSRQLSKEHEVSLSLMYSPREELKGTNPNTSGQTGTLYMEQTELEISYAWIF
ncbi:OmpP1/FadL family transporter [Candidatus Thiodiazotropha sp. CDECU1]|uniref:OmpP1/FadL family transporter n=1 Tax=Candidatus Thiodiazotropha sp. CDECU1 TaxID=3065865 RepID=UPI00292CF857|nr:outer membrane protein transport protein [Candidatus Thiodiazotropha sp. CDECU1]